MDANCSQGNTRTTIGRDDTAPLYETAGSHHYYLTEDSFWRLVHLKQHMRFLMRLAQSHTISTPSPPTPFAGLSEVAFCMDLLADQIDLILDELIPSPPPD